MEILEWIQNWYIKKCDGDWQHLYGIKIYNVDNPGWAVEIDIIDTELENEKFNNKIMIMDKMDVLLCETRNFLWKC